VTGLPIFSESLRDSRLGIALWTLGVCSISGMYIAFWPLMKGDEMQTMIESLPEGLVVAMGYDRILTGGGYVTSTTYGLMGLIVLLIFSVSLGARLVAGQEEDGILELELTGPVPRSRIYLERLLALWASITAPVLGLGVVTVGLGAAFDMGMPLVNVIAMSLGFGLFHAGIGTAAYAAGAASGRRAVALGVGAVLGIVAFLFNAIGPVVDLGWMTAASPVYWYLGNEPLDNGFAWAGIAKLALIPPLAAAAGWLRFRSRDLLV